MHCSVVPPVSPCPPPNEPPAAISPRPPTAAAAATAVCSGHAPSTPTWESLSDEQRNAVRAVRAGRNVFITGSGGCGKSHVLRYIIQETPVSSTFVTASTGVAALNIGGRTLHSFAGIRLGDGPVARLVEGIGRDAKKRWQHCRILVIDEISMLSGEFLDKVDAIGRALKCNESEPFGGIQVILCGDFLQLPPVNKSNDTTIKYGFESDVWPELRLHICYLRNSFRQSEGAFYELLNEIRVGALSRRNADYLSSIAYVGARPVDEFVTSTAVTLRSTHSEVRDINERHFRRLDGFIAAYTAEDHDVSGTDLIQHCIAPAFVELRKDTKVMLLTNMPGGNLVNGSIGTVVGFRAADATCPTEDPAAIPRLRRIQRDPGSMRPGATHPWFPVVRFDSNPSVPVAIEPQEWEVEENGRLLASRLQIPLMPAWAMTIHKAQGMSLDKVDIDMAKIFESGQAYVALSRVKTVEGLRLGNFRPEKVLVCERCKGFYTAMAQFLDSAEGQATHACLPAST